MNKYFIEQEYGNYVYPGHPLVLACYALISFDTIDEALEITENNCPRLVESTSVPGSGGSAYAAAKIIEMIRLEKHSQVMIDWAREWWYNHITNQKGYEEKLCEGQNQADRMENLFRVLVLEKRGYI